MSTQHRRSLELTWYGQAGFVVTFGRTSVGVDLFLSPHELRTYDPDLVEEFPTEVTHFLCSHLHGDHFDGPALAQLAARRALTIVVPQGAAVEAAAQVPAATVVGLNAGGRLDVDGLSVTGCPACHGDSMDDAYREGPYLGFVIASPGFPTVFHAGDSLATEGLVRDVAALRPDVVLLPINGRDAEREAAGVVGNMDVKEAYAFASAVGANAVVPMHYDAIRGNLADPAELVALASGSSLRVLVPTRGRPFALELPLDGS